MDSAICISRCANHSFSYAANLRVFSAARSARIISKIQNNIQDPKELLISIRLSFDNFVSLYGCAAMLDTCRLLHCIYIGRLIKVPKSPTNVVLLARWLLNDDYFNFVSKNSDSLPPKSFGLQVVARRGVTASGSCASRMHQTHLSAAQERTDLQKYTTVGVKGFRSHDKVFAHNLPMYLRFRKANTLFSYGH